MVRQMPADHRETVVVVVAERELLGLARVAREAILLSQRHQPVAKIDAKLRIARTTERQAETTLTKSREALAKAGRDEEHLKKQLESLAEKTQQLTDQIRRQEAALRQAESERMRLEEQREGA